MAPVCLSTDAVCLAVEHELFHNKALKPLLQQEMGLTGITHL